MESRERAAWFAAAAWMRDNTPGHLQINGLYEAMVNAAPSAFGAEWVLVSPDGKCFTGPTALSACKAEVDSRVTPEQQMANIRSAMTDAGITDMGVVETTECTTCGAAVVGVFEPAQEEYVYDPTTRFVHRSRDGKRLFRICFDRMDDDGWTGECEEVLNRMSSNLSSFNTKSVDHLARICYEWANETFPRRQMSSVLCKLFGEIGEFIDKPSPDEAADIFILISDLFKMNGIGIESAVEEKLKTLKAAAGWNESTIPGVYKRIK